MAKKKIPNIIVEIPSNCNNQNILSLLEHNTKQYLCVIDNITYEHVYAYILDNAIQEGIDLEVFFPMLLSWEKHKKHPLSVEFSKLGVSSTTNRIFKQFEISYVTRLVGVPFMFNIDTPEKIKRKKVTFVKDVQTINLRHKKA